MIRMRTPAFRLAFRRTHADVSTNSSRGHSWVRQSDLADDHHQTLPTAAPSSNIAETIKAIEYFFTILSQFVSLEIHRMLASMLCQLARFSIWRNSTFPDTRPERRFCRLAPKP